MSIFSRLALRTRDTIRIYAHHIIIERNMSTNTAFQGNSNLLSILQTNPKRFERIKFLANLYKEEGYELRIAGGAVRDILRDTDPQDIDFATTALPEESLRILSKHEDRLRIIVTAAGQKHGTVAVKFKEISSDTKKIKLSSGEDVGDEMKKEVNSKSLGKPEYDQESPFEITTLRCDKITDGRHAEVEFVNDWRIDAERRDLTINAMFLTLDEGKLIDYFNGAADLRDGLVRFVGDPDSRIKEDFLRILRFFRFWSRYGKSRQPDSTTASIIQTNLSGLNSISGERIWLETKKIFSHLPCHDVVQLMLKLGLFDALGFISNDVDKVSYQKSIGEEVRKIEEHVEGFKNTILRNLSDGNTETYARKVKDLLPVILISSAVNSIDVCARLHKRMKFSNLERDLLLYMIENRQEEPSLDKFKRQMFLASGPERPAMLLRIYAFMIYKGDYKNFNELETWQIPVFPLKGTTVAKELSKNGIHNRMIKTMFEKLKIDWCKSDYSLSENELHEAMQRLIDEHRGS